MSPELTCKELVELITDYIDGALSVDDRERFERHLSYCTACARYVEQFKLAIRISGKLRENRIAPEQFQQLRVAFVDWKKTLNNE